MMMTKHEIVSLAMSRRGLNQRTLAEKLGITQQGASRLLKAKDMRVESLINLLDVLECELVIKVDGEEFKVKPTPKE